MIHLTKKYISAISGLFILLASIASYYSYDTILAFVEENSDMIAANIFDENMSSDEIFESMIAQTEKTGTTATLRATNDIREKTSERAIISNGLSLDVKKERVNGKVKKVTLDEPLMLKKNPEWIHAKNINIQVKDGTSITTNGWVDSIAFENFWVHEAKKETKTLAEKKALKKQKRTIVPKSKREQNPTDTEESNNGWVETFDFWIQGQHLIFSKPVKVEIPVENLFENDRVEIFVKHEWDADFGVTGLSTDANTQCEANGSSTLPNNIATVRNGKVVFYTCGASSFTINTLGWQAWSNDLRLVIGDCGQFQLYYNWLANVYNPGTNPPANGCTNILDSWIALRIGNTTYGSDWTSWSSRTTNGSQSGNTYTATTTLTRNVGGRTYTVYLDWKYTAPNKFFTIDWRVVVPAGNGNNVRFYIANDSTVWWADSNDVGYYSTTPSTTIGVFDNALNQLSAIRYLSGRTWTAYQANGWWTVRDQITNGVNFTNNIQNFWWDLGFWVNWNFGTTPGTYTGSIEWRMLPYVSTNVPDIISGIGQPVPNLQVGVQSLIPITVTNVGNAPSTGTHSVTLTLSWVINGPTTGFTNNGWSCGAQIWTNVTCTKNTTIASLGNDTVNIPVVPTVDAAGASGNMVRFNATTSNAWDSNTTNNSSYVDLLVAVAANNGPTDITLSNNNLNENNTNGGFIANILGTDPDNNIVNYTFGCATPWADSSDFTISGNNLLAGLSYDYESPSDANGDNIYQICIRAIDGGWLYVDRNFTITVNDIDDLPPSITYSGIASGSLVPRGITSMQMSYADIGWSGINPWSATVTLEKWNNNTGLWGADIASTYTSKTTTATSSLVQISNLSYGKYRMTFSIADTVGNVATYTRIFFADEIEIMINTGAIDIGAVMVGNMQFSSQELIITVKTVGAWFSLTMNKSAFINNGVNEILDWDGMYGFWYDEFNGSSYTNSLSSIASNATITTEWLNINPTGEQRIYTYRIKYGTLTDPLQIGWDYTWNISIGILANY